MMKVKIYGSISEDDAVAIDITFGPRVPLKYCRISFNGLYNDCGHRGLEVTGVDLI